MLRYCARTNATRKVMSNRTTHRYDAVLLSNARAKPERTCVTELKEKKLCFESGFVLVFCMSIIIQKNNKPILLIQVVIEELFFIIFFILCFFIWQGGYSSWEMGKSGKNLEFVKIRKEAKSREIVFFFVKQSGWMWNPKQIHLKFIFYLLSKFVICCSFFLIL